MIPMVPDVCIRFDDDRTTMMNMIIKFSDGRSSYEDTRRRNVGRRETLGNSLIVN